MTPKGEKVSPAQNLKKLFKARHATELLMAWLWCLVWLIAASIIAYLGLPRLLTGTVCVMQCVSLDFADMLVRLFIVLIIMLLISGIVDLAIQKTLFAGEMRMTDSERKRDLRETEGDPHIKQEVRRRARGEDGGGGGFMMPGGNRDWSHATCLLVGSQTLLAVRYSTDDNPPLPHIVRSMPLNFVDSDTAQAISAANLPRVEGAVVADKIGTRYPAGSIIPEAHLLEVMRTLYQANLIK